jgi:hypothetical protein
VDELLAMDTKESRVKAADFARVQYLYQEVLGWLDKYLGRVQ